jgi:hypothetical protein
MINKKIVETKSTRSITESVTCDICDKVFTGAKEIVGGIEWDQFDNAHAAHTGVYIGRRNEDEDVKFTYRHYHICPECFEGMLVPWLKKLGIKPTLEETVW